MIDALTLPDGRTVRLGARIHGGSKNHTSDGTLNSGQSVVVKVQATHGQLPREEAALNYAAQHGLQAPTVIGSGTTETGS